MLNCGLNRLFRSRPVVPASPVILDGTGKQVEGLIGPYTLGDTILLACHVNGGTPILLLFMS